jgi:tRNA pseudouridine55 synthase
MAAGVLSMCIGSATRAAEYVESDEKTYRCELQLGTVTDTGDIWGTPLTAGSYSDITEEQVLKVLHSMEGEQGQYPPKYSAVRKNGRHLYEYARNGEKVEIEPRHIVVHKIEPISVFHEPGRVMFDVKCSKGTYVRTICTDIGDKLGCGAAMSFLVRTESGSFHIDDAVTLEDLTAYVSSHEGLTAGEILAAKRDGPITYDMSRFIMPIDSRLGDFGRILLDETEHKKYVNGGKLSRSNVYIEKENGMTPGTKYSDMFCVYGADGRFAGTAVFDRKNNYFKAGKVFFR